MDLFYITLHRNPTGPPLGTSDHAGAESIRANFDAQPCFPRHWSPAVPQFWTSNHASAATVRADIDSSEGHDVMCDEMRDEVRDETQAERSPQHARGDAPPDSEGIVAKVALRNV